MTISKKMLGILICCSVALNIYQYQLGKTLFSTAKSEHSDTLSNKKYVHDVSSTNNTVQTPSSPDISSIKYSIVNSSSNLHDSEASLSNSNDSDDFFKHELSLYLGDEVVDLVNIKNEKEQLQLLNMLNSNDVRQEDVELESKFNLLFESYSDSMLAGSQDVRCNSSGCYISYVLTDRSSEDKIYFDLPKLPESTSSGYTFKSSDGNFRYVDFILTQ